MRRLAAATLILAATAAAAESRQELEESTQQDPGERVHGSRAAFSPVDLDQEAVSVPAETPLRSHPDSRAARLSILPETLVLPVLERQGPWVRIRYGDLLGWVAPSGEPRPEASTPLPVAAQKILVGPDPVEERAARLAEARAHLQSENRRRTTLGRWPLHTDIDNDDLLDHLDKVARLLPEVYRARFGLEPKIENLAPIVLYRREVDYRAFADAKGKVVGLGADGHADNTLAALHSGNYKRSELTSVLVHELTHLLNRTRFVRSPNTWLEEGMANDLSLSRVDEEGRVVTATLGGEQTMTTRRTPRNRTSIFVSTTGGRVVFLQLLQAWKRDRNRVPRLEELLDLPWVDFVDRDRRSMHYSTATFFVRFLLDHSGPDSRESFLRFVEGTANGSPSNAEDLADAMGTTPAELSDSFRRWLTRQIARVR